MITEDFQNVLKFCLFCTREYKFYIFDTL